MQPWTNIPTRSRRQAMDWSLVLVSQEIETAIEEGPSPGQYQLSVPARDHDRALGAIRQYQRENRRWSWAFWESRVRVGFEPLSLIWCALVAAVFWIDQQTTLPLREAGIVASDRLRLGEWWRIFTGISLHSSTVHLLTNVTFGFLLLGLAMARYGCGMALLLALIAGAVGNVVSVVLHGAQFQGLGASGMVMGALGLLCVPLASVWREERRSWRATLKPALGGVFLFTLLGLSPESDVVAHAGGFAAGLALAIVLPHRVSREPLPFRWQTLALLTSLLVWGCTWALALMPRSA